MKGVPHSDYGQRFRFLARVGKELYPLVSMAQRHSTEVIWLTGSTLRNYIIQSPRENCDVDFVFFNHREISKNYEKKIEFELSSITGVPAISVKNQARIAPKVDGYQHENIFRSIDAFPDVTVAMAVRVLDFEKKALLFYVPYGFSCFDEESIHPTMDYLSRHSTAGYNSWIEKKNYAFRLPRWRISRNALGRASRTGCYLVSCR